MSAFFVKFSHNNTNKKVQITKDQLNWENVCSILEKSFFMAEKDKIQLKYKDYENDEITVNSDQDLAEAYNLYFMKNLIKFFVYYSGVFDNEQKHHNASGYSKMERPRSLASISPKNISLNNSQKLLEKSLELSQASTKNALVLNKEIPIISEPKFSKVKIESDELVKIFSEVFETTEVLQKIQAKLANYISEDDKKSNEVIEYSIDTDYKAITDYMVSNLNSLLNKKIEQKPAIEDKIILNKEDVEESKVQIDQNLSKIELRKDNGVLLDVSLGESIYERSDNNILNGSLGRSFKDSRKSVECKDLSSSHGVKLVLKYENGKAKFVSIPLSEYSIIEVPKAEDNTSSNNQSKRLSKINEKSKIEDEDYEELEKSVHNVVLNLNKKSSIENKPSEFTKKILKANLHDLDQDLPAPYDLKFVNKFEKGLNNSVYEKIE